MNESNLILNILIAISAAQGFVVPKDDIRENIIDSEEELPVAEPEEKWFEQYLDHLNIQDNRTFYMRYMEEDKFFKPGGPLLLNIGGEGAIYSIESGQSYLLAEQLHGKLVLIEHRYYGKSSPFSDLTAENLTYLTVEQALEDLAYFVDSYKKTTPGLEHSKVGVFGCSYSASLATWFRYKFPHLVDAAWASSAPLHAVSDFYQYLEVASQVYANVSSHCYNIIKEGYDQTKHLLDTPEGENQIKAIFGNWTCGNVTEMSGPEILGNLRFVLADHNIPLDHGVESCKILQKGSKDISAFKKLMALVTEKSPDVCSADDAEFPNDGKAWGYQVCTEFGFSITTSSKSQPFDDPSVTVEADMESCLDYGDEFDMELLKRGIERINRVYGSVHLKATKVLSVHGTHDPWYKLGLYEQSSEEAPVILLPGVAHCGDQIAYDDEPSYITKAKHKARKIMAEWLK